MPNPVSPLAPRHAGGRSSSKGDIAGHQARELARKSQEEADWLASVGLRAQDSAHHLMRRLANGPRERVAALKSLTRFHSLSESLRKPITGHWDRAVWSDPKSFARLDAEALCAIGAAGAEWGQMPGGRTAVFRRLKTALIERDIDAMEALTGFWGSSSALNAAEARMLRQAAEQSGESERLALWLPGAYGCERPEAIFEDDGAKGLLGQFSRSLPWADALGPRSDACFQPQTAQDVAESKSRASGLRTAWSADWAGERPSKATLQWGLWAFENDRSGLWALWASVAKEAIEAAGLPPDGERDKMERGDETLLEGLLAVALRDRDVFGWIELAKMGVASELRMKMAHASPIATKSQPFMMIIDEYPYYFGNARPFRFWGQDRIRPLWAQSSKDTAAALLLPGPILAPKINRAQAAWADHQRRKSLPVLSGSPEATERDDQRLLAAMQAALNLGGAWAALAEKAQLQLALDTAPTAAECEDTAGPFPDNRSPTSTRIASRRI